MFWNVLRRHQLVFFTDALSRNVGIKLQIDAAKNSRRMSTTSTLQRQPKISIVNVFTSRDIAVHIHLFFVYSTVAELLP
jgi:hypothetical protein